MSIKKICYYLYFIVFLFSSTDSIADSTTSTNIIPPMTNPVRPDIKVNTPQLPDRANPYETIPICPANPVCPDINGNPPPGKTLNCPSFCIDERDAPLITVNPNRYAYVKNAVCPSGYSASHVYKVGREITWNANPPIVPPPITRAQYSIMKNAGYQCYQSKMAGTQRYCASEPWYMTCAGCDDCTCHDSKDNPSKYISNMRDVGDVMVQVVAKRKYPVCKGTCWTRSCVSITHNWTTEYTWIKIQCQPPAGWYETVNQVPTALICSRVQPVWNK